MVKNDKRKFDDIDANVIMTRSKTKSLKQSNLQSQLQSQSQSQSPKKKTTIRRSPSDNCYKRRKVNNLEILQKKLQETQKKLNNLEKKINSNNIRLTRQLEDSQNEIMKIMKEHKSPQSYIDTVIRTIESTHTEEEREMMQQYIYSLLMGYIAHSVDDCIITQINNMINNKNNDELTQNLIEFPWEVEEENESVEESANEDISINEKMECDNDMSDFIVDDDVIEYVDDAVSECADDNDKDYVYEDDEEDDEEDIESETEDNINILNCQHKGLRMNIVEKTEKSDRTNNKTNKKLYKEYFNLLNQTPSTGNGKNDLKYFYNLSIDEKEKILTQEKELQKLINFDEPLRFKIINSTLSPKIKARALEKVTSLARLENGSGEYNKLKNWIYGLMQIPWNNYYSMPVNITNSSSEIHNYLINCQHILDDAIYGQIDTKTHIIQIISQLISNPNALGNVFAIHGPMGTGKTTIIKEGIAKALGRPFEFVSLGGMTDASYLEGHGYTYEGSIPGIIVQILKKSGCMNPIIYFDELDKVSMSNKGDEIINKLIHMTDHAQNYNFQDRYYAGIPIDISKVLFIFSYNNEQLINPILRDRMYAIKVDSFKRDDKVIIAKDYLLPNIYKSINMKENQVIFNDDIIKYIINTFTSNEEGVRNLKRCLETVISKLNVLRLTQIDNIEQTLINDFTNNNLNNNLNNNINNNINNTTYLITDNLPKTLKLSYQLNKIKFPLVLNRNIIDKLLKISKNKIPFHMYT